MDKPFIEIDHSGDIGIHAWGTDVAQLIENVTLGLFSLIYRGTVESRVERELRVESSSEENLIVDWLCEVLSTIGARGELYGSVRVTRVGKHFAVGVLGGEQIDAARHDLRFEVKAATYHGLSVERRKDRLHARVIFDL
ncbi:MAG: archease [Candidatus Latescibacterota bacterium]|nr:MAG: archease [Candidatus Latescibacterota bacterium]